MTSLSASALTDDLHGCAVLREVTARPQPSSRHPWRRACLGFAGSNLALILAVLLLGQGA